MYEISSDRIEIAALYLAKRQLQGRPTTLRQFGKRIGMAGRRMLDAMEGVGIRYVLIPHVALAGRVRWGSSNTEVLLQVIPEKFGVAVGIDPKKIMRSFVAVLGEDPQPVPEYKEAVEYDALIGDTLDPFTGYYISKDQYEVLKDNLITFAELVQIAKENRYSEAAIRRATGGDRMQLPLPSFFWRPYVVGKKRYYLKDVVDHLVESDRTYKSRAKLDSKRRERFGDPDVDKFIQFHKKKDKKASSRKKVFNEGPA